MKPNLSLVCALALAAAGAFGCKSATVASTPDENLPPLPRPKAVYVVDFELMAATVQHEEGILPRRGGPVGRISERLSGSTSDPATRARQIVELMSASLVKDLAKPGFNAVRLQVGAPFPTEGWLPRGVFTDVQEGNRLRRAMIGFGEGQTDIQVVANVQDLSEGPPKPLYEIATDAASGDKAGAAPALVLGPYGATRRFVMAGTDLDKNVKQTAAQIAERLARRVAPSNQTAH